MNCDKCQELLSDLLEGSITAEDRALLNKHFDQCFGCVAVRDDLQAIVSVAHEERGQYVAPPNERALWLRIQNTLEGEINARRDAVAGAATTAARQRNAEAQGNWWSRLMSKRWEVSLPQLTTAVTAIMIAVSFITTITMRSIQNGQAAGEGSAGTEDVLTNRASAVGSNPETYVQHQQPAIEYWRQRVEQRKAHWNPRMREAFERNMDVVDQAVKDSLIELRRSPHDDVSEEMLNAALRNKVELLQEFSDL